MAHILPEPPRTWDYPMAAPPPLCPHGVPYAQRCNGCGWVCPTCKRSYAPWVRECNYRHEGDPQAPAGPVAVNSLHAPLFPSAAAPVPPIAPPPEMTQPGRMRYVRVADGWTEILPGLQADCKQGVDIRLRLTPEGDTT